MAYGTNAPPNSEPNQGVLAQIQKKVEKNESRGNNVANSLFLYISMVLTYVSV